MSATASRVALVTGASRGIGRAVALRLAQDGYDVAFCYRRAGDAAQSVADAIEAAGRRALARRCDVSELAQVRELVAAAEDGLGPVDAVVNCAGIVKDGPLVMMDEAAWHDVIGTNLDGVFNVCRSVVFPFMKRRGGAIVNLSSVAGVYGNATQANYSASKAGIIGFSKALAKEVGRYGIRVNVVAPGFISTDMTERLDDKLKEHVLTRIPLGRMGEADEVAELVSYLVSDRAAYVTGQTIQIDGGIVL